MDKEKEIMPVDKELFCPNCAEQHVDKAEPDVCQDCGHVKELHNHAGCNWSRENGGGMSGKLRSIEFCHCESFNAWLNPPHKKHRCRHCNHVWKPFDYPTNGVASLSND